MKKYKLIILLLIPVILIGVIVFTQEKEGNLGNVNSFFPPSIDFQRAVDSSLDRILSNKIFDIVWDDFFHYFTNFDSIVSTNSGDRTFEVGGTTATTLDGWEVSTLVATTTASFMQKVQMPTLGGIQTGLNRNLSWGEPQRFRANFSFTDTTSSSLPRLTAYIVRGATPQSNFNHPNFGFKIATSTNASTSLWGISRNAGIAEGRVLLYERLATSTAYIVEARYFPNDKITFSVLNTTTSLMEERGVLTTNLPNSTSTLTSAFYGMEVTGVEDHTIQFLGSFFEYIQKIRRF